MLGWEIVAALWGGDFYKNTPRSWKVQISYVRTQIQISTLYDRLKRFLKRALFAG